MYKLQFPLRNFISFLPFFLMLLWFSCLPINRLWALRIPQRSLWNIFAHSWRQLRSPLIFYSLLVHSTTSIFVSVYSVLLQLGALCPLVSIITRDTIFPKEIMKYLMKNQLPHSITWNTCKRTHLLNVLALRNGFLQLPSFSHSTHSCVAESWDYKTKTSIQNGNFSQTRYQSLNTNVCQLFVYICNIVL